MVRRRVWVLAGAALALATALASAGMVGGPVAQKKVFRPGAYEFAGFFTAGQRACVMVVGDQNPVVPLKLRVFDANNKLVASDEPSGDFAAVMWYPPRDGPYRIRFEFTSNVDNVCQIVFK